jgi:ABC-type dipeptide/oligopeptide/nickel transport system permease subunit
MGIVAPDTSSGPDGGTSKGLPNTTFGFAPTLKRLTRSKSSLFGFVIVVILLITAAAAPMVSPHDPAFAYRDAVRLPPGSSLSWDTINDEFAGIPEGQFQNARTNKFLLGTDKFGRDILSRIIYGAQVSLIVGVVAELIALLLGIVIGALAGYFGGWIDSVLSRLTDTFFSFPSLLLAIGILAVFERPGLFTIFIALGLVGWTMVARIVRGQVIRVKEEDFIEAARAMGASDLRIIIRHILPNSMAPIIVVGTLGVAANILSEAGLSFLGLGVQPPTPSWGIMLSEGRNFIESAPWICIFPGLAILFTVLGFNLLGDGLRDALDPRLKIQ